MLCLHVINFVHPVNRAFIMFLQFLKRTKGLVILMTIFSFFLYHAFLSICGLIGYYSYALYPNERIFVYSANALLIGSISGLLFSYFYKGKPLNVIIIVSSIYFWYPVVTFMYYELLDAILGLILTWIIMLISMSIVKSFRKQ